MTFLLDVSWSSWPLLVLLLSCFLGLKGDSGHASEDAPVDLRKVLVGAQYPYLPTDEAVDYTPPTVDMRIFHDDGVLHLRVQDGGVVSYAGIGPDVGVGADVAVVPKMAAADCWAAVDFASPFYSNAISPSGGVLHFPMVVWF